MASASTSRRPLAHPRSGGGFTLFEVLAAALVLVLVGTITIGSMSANLSHLSDARMRLEAGRIADARLADLEATLFDGSAPAVGAQEETVGPFVVSTKVLPFGALFDKEQLEAGAEAGSPSLFSLIAEELPGLPRHLRALEVRVAWGDPSAPEMVERTSMAFDHTASLQALQDLAQGGGGEEEAP